MVKHLIEGSSMKRTSDTKGTKMNVYGISGLGADERVYQNISLPNNQANFITIEWIEPMNINESISSYSKRLVETQIDTSKPYVLIGVSFGGLIATEINNLINIERKPTQTILISSINHRHHLPNLYKFIGKIGILKFLPTKLLQYAEPPTFVMAWLFQVSPKEHKDLLSCIIKDTDRYFLKWALIQLTTWNNEQTPTNTIRIHGTNDLLLPAAGYIDHIIPNGGHFMVVDSAKQINEILARTYLLP